MLVVCRLASLLCHSFRFVPDLISSCIYIPSSCSVFATCIDSQHERGATRNRGNAYSDRAPCNISVQVQSQILWTETVSQERDEPKRSATIRWGGEERGGCRGETVLMIHAVQETEGHRRWIQDVRRITDTRSQADRHGQFYTESRTQDKEGYSPSATHLVLRLGAVTSAVAASTAVTTALLATVATTYITDKSAMFNSDPRPRAPRPCS